LPDLIPPLYRSHLREVLATRMELPVELEVATCEGCESCDRAVALAEELSGLSDRISFRMAEGAPGGDTDEGAQSLKRPSITVKGMGGTSLVFFGAPIGSELDVLVDAIFAASRHRSRLPSALVRRLQGIDKEIRVEIFVSPACRRCPPVARFLMEAGIETGRLRVEVVEAFEFPDLARKYGVRSVPAAVLGSGAVKVYDATVPKVAALLLELSSRQDQE
jgi:alkyl hydroperoxide reductase subunit AhpF